jgi:hypothetical protein
LWSQEQFAKVHVELNAHLYYGAAEAWLLFKAADQGDPAEVGNDIFQKLKILMIFDDH